MFVCCFLVLFHLSLHGNIDVNSQLFTANITKKDLCSDWHKNIHFNILYSYFHKVSIFGKQTKLTQAPLTLSVLGPTLSTVPLVCPRTGASDIMTQCAGTAQVSTGRATTVPTIFKKYFTLRKDKYYYKSRMHPLFVLNEQGQDGVVAKIIFVIFRDEKFRLQQDLQHL